jgi:Ca-activated chloride channel homolog
LGELSGTERAAVAAYLVGCPASRHHVAEVRATANLLVDELARESFGGLTELQHAAIEQKLDDALRIPLARARHRRRLRWDRTVLAMSVAASVLIFFGVLTLIVAFVSHHVDLVFQPDSQSAEQPANPDSRKILPFAFVPHHEDGPRVAEKPNEKTLPSHPAGRPKDAIEEVDPEDITPDETFAHVPQPDKHFADNTEREPGRLFVGPQPHDKVIPKPKVEVTHSAEPGIGPTITPDAAPKVKDNTNAGYPLGPQVSAKDHSNADRSTHGAFPHADAFPHLVETPYVKTAEEPISGFSAGVDTASYSNIRRFLTHEMRPPADAVRIEEMLNYFPVRAPQPALPSAGEGPLALQLEVGACPWEPTRRLARVCLQARDLPPWGRPAVNLVFVVNVSPAMRGEKAKLPLLKQAMRSLVVKLSARDRISIVSYALEAVSVLPPTLGDDRKTILSAIDRLEFAGRSNGGQGIEIAYEALGRSLINGGVNRIILATDGDLNVGVTDHGQLESIVRDQTHKNGVSLTVLGVGMSNLNDARLQKLAIAGNGSYAYIDTIDEARKVLADQVNGALVSVARNVKVQITFNPATASDYRLIGYERRVLRKDEIKSESTQGGELGAGQSVTALYEVIPVAKSAATRPAELLTATVTYADPGTQAPHTLKASAEDHATPVPRTSLEFRFAAAVAEFGLLLRDSDYKGNSTWSDVLDRARESVGPDDARYRHELVKLIQKASILPPAK